MSITHSRVSRLEEKVGISPKEMFVFSAPCALYDGSKPEFTDDDFFRLVGRERRPEDLVVVLLKFYDPSDPDSKKAMTMFGPGSEVNLRSSRDLNHE